MAAFWNVVPGSLVKPLAINLMREAASISETSVNF
jgi:hypothetical protein